MAGIIIDMKFNKGTVLKIILPVSLILIILIVYFNVNKKRDLAGYSTIVCPEKEKIAIAIKALCKYEKAEKKKLKHLEDLYPKYVSEVPRDLWGNKFNYNPESKTISSSGRDGEFETSDDIIINYGKPVENCSIKDFKFIPSEITKIEFLGSDDETVYEATEKKDIAQIVSELNKLKPSNLDKDTRRYYLNGKRSSKDFRIIFTNTDDIVTVRCFFPGHCLLYLGKTWPSEDYFFGFNKGVNNADLEVSRKLNRIKALAFLEKPFKSNEIKNLEFSQNNKILFSSSDDVVTNELCRKLFSSRTFVTAAEWERSNLSSIFPYRVTFHFKLKRKPIYVDVFGDMIKIDDRERKVVAKIRNAEFSQRCRVVVGDYRRNRKRRKKEDNFLKTVVKHSFGIYLVKEGTFFEAGKDPWYIKPVAVNLQTAELLKEPVISDKDIIEYDWSSHTVTVSKEAASRIPVPDSFGTPFIVIVDGKRYYVGGFWSILSSVSCPYPVIEDMDIRDGQFTIKRSSFGKMTGETEDPRFDSKIKTCLEALGKLKIEKKVILPQPLNNPQRQQ